MRPDQGSPVSPRKLRLYGTVGIGVLAAVVATGIITRSKVMLNSRNGPTPRPCRRWR